MGVCRTVGAGRLWRAAASLLARSAAMNRALKHAVDTGL